MKKLKIFESKVKGIFESSRFDDFVLLLSPSDDIAAFKSWYEQNYSAKKSDDELQEIFDSMIEGTGYNAMFRKFALGGKTPSKGIKIDKDRGFTNYYVDPDEAQENGWEVDTGSTYDEVRE